MNSLRMKGIESATLILLNGKSKSETIGYVIDQRKAIITQCGIRTSRGKKIYFESADLLIYRLET